MSENVVKPAHSETHCEAEQGAPASKMNNVVQLVGALTITYLYLICFLIPYHIIALWLVANRALFAFLCQTFSKIFAPAINMQERVQSCSERITSSEHFQSIQLRVSRYWATLTSAQIVQRVSNLLQDALENANATVAWAFATLSQWKQSIVDAKQLVRLSALASQWWGNSVAQANLVWNNKVVCLWKFVQKSTFMTLSKLSFKQHLTAHSVQESAHPVQENAHPVQESAHSVQESAHPVQENGHPLKESAHPVQEKREEEQQKQEEPMAPQNNLKVESTPAVTAAEEEVAVEKATETRQSEESEAIVNSVASQPLLQPAPEPEPAPAQTADEPAHTTEEPAVELQKQDESEETIDPHQNGREENIAQEQSDKKEQPMAQGKQKKAKKSQKNK